MPSSNDQTFTPNNVWASAPIDGVQEELIMPSGQTCRARRISVQAVIETGMIGQLDSLTATVDSYTRKVKGGKGVPDGSVVMSDKLLGDTEALNLIIGAVDQIIPHVVVSPNVKLHYTQVKVGETVVTKLIKAEDRQPGQVYTDMIDFTDKMFLFEWSVGGLAGLTSFRGETHGDVGDVELGQGPRGKAKRRNRNR